MTMLEISLARAYLAKSGQDPVTALIRSVRDLARMRQLLSARLDIEGRKVPADRAYRTSEHTSIPALVAG